MTVAGDTQPMTRAEDVLEEINAMFPQHVPYLLLSPWPTSDLREHGLALIGHPASGPSVGREGVGKAQGTA